MGITERKLRQREEVRALILAAAWQLVQKEGWQALSIRKIADAIEYSSPVIYDHFVNKEAIMQEFTQAGYRKLNAKLESVKKEFSDPEKQIEAIAYAYWQFAFEDKEYYRLMYGLGIPTCDMVKQIPELKTFTELIIGTIRELIEKSNNKESDPLLKLHTFWSMIHGLISINIIGKGSVNEELNKLVLKDFIAGFISGIKK